MVASYNTGKVVIYDLETSQSIIECSAQKDSSKATYSYLHPEMLCV